MVRVGSSEPGGECVDPTDRFEPFVWAGQDHLVALGPADALGGYVPYEIAVSADGLVAVGSSFMLESRAYRWTEADGFELIELPQGFTSGNATSMSDDGLVVVGNTGDAHRSFRWSEGAGAVVLSPLEGHDGSRVHMVSPDGSVAAGSSFRLGALDAFEDVTVVYWRADGVPHHIADELAARGVDLGEGSLGEAVRVRVEGELAAGAPLGFFGSGSKDGVNYFLSWRARLP